MSSVSIDEARAKLSALIHGLHPGDEIVITESEQTVARMLPATPGEARKNGNSARCVER
jgi:antitoxin (DNA-binding transcriptional repressor) of toxin-antitoxin stability system